MQKSSGWAITGLGLCLVGAMALTPTPAIAIPETGAPVDISMAIGAPAGVTVKFTSDFETKTADVLTVNTCTVTAVGEVAPQACAAARFVMGPLVKEVKK